MILHAGWALILSGDSIAGPIVAITNEYAGSMEIFSAIHLNLELGKLIGKELGWRYWNMAKEFIS